MISKKKHKYEAKTLKKMLANKYQLCVTLINISYTNNTIKKYDDKILFK